MHEQALQEKVSTTRAITVHQHEACAFACVSHHSCQDSVGASNFCIFPAWMMSAAMGSAIDGGQVHRTQKFGFSSFSNPVLCAGVHFCVWELAMLCVGWSVLPFWSISVDLRGLTGEGAVGPRSEAESPSRRSSQHGGPGAKS